MNFGAFPFPVCAPLKPRHKLVDYPGTSNIACGHRMREPNSNCRYMKQFYDLRMSAVVNPWEIEEAKERQRLLHKMAFERHTERKFIAGEIRRRVEQGMAAYEEDIEIRREKLRGMILTEEAALTKAIVDQAERGHDFRMDEKRAQIEKLRRQQEEEHATIVAAKRMQQYLGRCPDTRDRFSRQFIEDTKHCNSVQMAENEAKRKAEKELDMLWHELMLKEIEAKKCREVEEEEKRAAATKAVIATLEKQVAGKLTLATEEKCVKHDQLECLERLWENIRKEELCNLAKERRKRDKLKEDLENQLLAAKRRLAERARKEAEIDQMFKTLAERELAKEKAAIKETSAALRRELLAYMKNLEDLRVEEARRNIEVERIVEQSRMDAEARRDLAVKKFKEARARSLQEVLRGRKQQLRMKREVELEVEKRKEEERESLRKELELDAELIARERNNRKEKALLYGRELKAQQKYVETVRCRELEEDERMYRRGLEKEEEYRKLIEELLDASELITPHAFKILLKECAARHAAEQKGTCYCPPALPREYC